MRSRATLYLPLVKSRRASFQCDNRVICGGKMAFKLTVRNGEMSVLKTVPVCVTLKWIRSCRQRESCQSPTRSPAVAVEVHKPQAQQPNLRAAHKTYFSNRQ